MINKAIGVFDSGIGGLTVFKAIKRLLPNEKLIYFGDTARIPYGTKSEKLVRQYALEDTVFLMQNNIKMVVIACNTASAMALDYLKSRLDVPVVGVVLPGSSGAVRETKNKIIGVIGTLATINSMAYNNAILNSLADARVYSKACPLLVPLVEEGILKGDIAEMILNNYLMDIISNDADTLILGCTHYPLLSETIQKIVGQNVTLIDSGAETALVVQKILNENNLLNKEELNVTDEFYVSDIPQKFEELGTRFLGKTMTSVRRVDFEYFLDENNDIIKKLKRSIKEVDAGVNI